MVWRDSSGKALSDYPRPSLAVDVALLTVRADEDGDLALCVLLQQHDDGSHSLPGAFVHEGERLIDAVRRTVKGKLGLTTRDPRQLRVFDEPSRDSRGHVVSVAHADLLPEDQLQGQGSWLLAPVEGTRARVPGRRRSLRFDHDEIVAVAVQWARDRYKRRPDPSHLLGDSFTLRELRLLHEAVQGERLQKDTFRRLMLDRLEELPERTTGSPGRPAAKFRHRR